MLDGAAASVRRTNERTPLPSSAGRISVLLVIRRYDPRFDPLDDREVAVEDDAAGRFCP
ncbi:MAG TPA: hypothetical protein VGE81_02025 [Candidatus Limnocylindrales bacterium]